MSEPMTGAELAGLILRRGTTAAEVAAMDLASLTRSVAYRRQSKIPSGAVSPGMTDEQIARALLEYAQSDPGDWPVAPRATTSKRGCGPGLLGALGGGLGAIVFGIAGGIVLVYDQWVVDMYLVLAMLVAPVAASLAAFLGAALALVVTRRMTGTERLKRVILPLATGLAVGSIIAGGYWLGMLAWEGQLDHFINHYVPRSGHFLLERYQAGERGFYDWNLRGAHLSGADLSGANLLWANLSGADLSHADLSGAKLRKTNLSEADLSGANLSGADLDDAHLSGANLSWADLSVADLSDADLTDANLSGTDLTDADLSRADLRGATLDDSTKLDENHRLVWSILNEGGAGRDLAEADLSGADLSGADLSGADLSGASLQTANLIRADLSDADLSGALLQSANLISADLRRADLSGADLFNADLISADLRGADLSEADLRRAEVFDWQLAEAASLRGATLPDGSVHK